MRSISTKWYIGGEEEGNGPRQPMRRIGRNGRRGLPLRLLNPQLTANRQKSPLRKILVAVKRNDGISASRRIDPSAMASDAVTPDAAERLDVFLGLFGGHRPHAIAILRAEDRRAEDRAGLNLLASSAVRSQHVMASMSFGASSSKVSATVRHPGIAGISAQYAPSS